MLAKMTAASLELVAYILVLLLRRWHLAVPLMPSAHFNNSSCEHNALWHFAGIVWAVPFTNLSLFQPYTICHTPFNRLTNGQLVSQVKQLFFLAIWPNQPRLWLCLGAQWPTFKLIISCAPVWPIADNHWFFDFFVTSVFLSTKIVA